MVTNILRTFVLLRFVIQVHVAAQNLDVVVHVEFSRYPHIGMSHSALYRIYVCKTYRRTTRKSLKTLPASETRCSAMSKAATLPFAFSQKHIDYMGS